MRDFSIGNLQVLGASVSDYVLGAPVEGLEFPALRVTSYDRPGEDGGVVSNVFYGTRGVTLVGLIRGSTCEQYEEARRALAAACAYSKDAYGYPTLTTFTFTTDAGDSYFFEGQVTKATFNIDKTIKSSRFLINVVVPNPQLFSTGLSSTGVFTRRTGSGFEWPFDWPILWGDTTGGSAIANNLGNTSAWPIITITGQVTNPVITNDTIDKFIQLTATTTASDVIVIDMANKTIIKNGSQSLLSAKTADSSWWWLDPGINAIGFSTSSSSDTGTVEVTWYSAVLGV